MKKILLPVLFGIFGLGFFAKPVTVFAEEASVNETVENQAEEQTDEETDEEKEIDDLLAQLQEYGIDVSGIVNVLKTGGIISVGTIISVLTAILTIVAKYSKYKYTTVDTLVNTIKEKTGDYVKENFEKLGKEEITKITDAIGALETSTETIMKVLVLMQDSTAKGKVALLEYLGSKTNNEEIKESAEKINEQINEQEAAKDEVKEQVSGEYKDIF